MAAQDCRQARSGFCGRRPRGEALKKIFLLLLLLASLLAAGAAEAAKVTGVHWGVDKENVLRFVVDLTEQAAYKTELENGALTLTAEAELEKSAAGSQRVKSGVANTVQTAASGSRTVVRIPLLKQITANDYKSFTLKKDPATGRPARIVLDITAEKKAAAPAAGVKVNPAAPAVSKSTAVKTAASANGVVISNKPVKGSAAGTPVKSTAAAPKSTEKKNDNKTVKDSKTAKNNKTAKSSDAKGDSGKTAPAKPAAAEAVKGSGKYAVSGGIKGRMVVIDPGHGGSDPGAIGDSGLKEKTVTLSVSKKLQELLQKKGAKVTLTRSNDADVYGPYASDVNELQARVNVAEKNNADIFISVHINSSTNKKVGGFSSYYYPKTAHDKRLAQKIQDKLAKNFGRDNLGVREANFYVTKRSSMPAVLLELCFISNKDEEKLLQSAWFQNKAAKLIAEGVEEYFK